MKRQKLSFSELYNNCKRQAEKTLVSLWCGEIGNESQADYAKQIRELIKGLFAPENAIPLVECTNRYKSVSSVSDKESRELVGGLWDKTYSPYEHQYQCWNTVLKEKTEDGKHKSFVITTGTGSGKTECFMLPLVYDLKNQPLQETTQAIFLYPLNALMEDQKERLEELLKDTDLRYCVYNGDLPEEEPDPDDKKDYAKEVRRKIDAIRGIERDGNGNIIEHKFKHCIATRKELRNHPAQILLTNPTMLEYILLRTKDSTLINEKSLRWIVIDETHTYTGAGAAEMAMLLRRVLLAFDLEASDVRFATSSATLGNPKTPEEKIEMEEKLKTFISDLTGLPIDNLKVIGGERKGEETIPDNEDAEIWRRLIDSRNGFIPLNKLFDDKGSISEQLSRLDEMCDRLPDKTDLKVKVHFFFRVPNNGLFVRLSEPINGSFKVYSEKSTDLQSNEAPLIELSRCRHCGEYVAVAQINKRDMTYGPILMDETDMFELEQEEEEKSDKFIFGRTNRKLQAGDNNVGFIIEGDKFIEFPGMMNDDGDWRTIANVHNRCPHCNTKLTKTVSEEVEEDPIEEEDGKKLLKFRFSTDLISRIIAPEVLDQLVEAEDTKDLLHKGQQYISFVDSRQGAARGALGQNLEQERLWVYSKIFHELNERKSQASLAKKKIEELEKILDKLDRKKDRKKILEIYDQIEELEGIAKGVISWQEITEILSNDSISDKFASQFAKRTAGSDELDDGGNVKPEVKRRYIQSILVEFLGKRPLHSGSPETMGLFGTYYPSLDSIEELPKAVNDFNGRIQDEELKISLEDWKNLLQVFLDFQVRSNESIFLRLRDDDPLDIKSCVRFATQRQRRRTVHKPIVRTQQPSRIVRFLAQLLADDGAYDSQMEALRNEQDLFQDVVDALWYELTCKSMILEHGTQYDKDKGHHIKDRDNPKSEDPVPWRLNVSNLSFKLFDKVAMVDTNTNGSELSSKRFRPVNVWFKNYSPYLKNRTQIMRISPELIGEWTHYTALDSIGGLKTWAKEERKLLWDNNLWGEEGVFARRLESIYGVPDLFIQSEHTAQVDKMISRKVQKDFKNHKLNILACSTTMEMGVDLGDLELVMMTSVPPQPSNYKQRAGRSGRNEYVKSVALTLCGSDAVGLRTQMDPVANIIEREMADPATDLSSAQVIQRHINAFLVREFGVFRLSTHGGSINQKVAEYYTLFKRENNNGYIEYIMPDGHKANPTDGLGDIEMLTTKGELLRTPYEIFNNCCIQKINDELKKKLELLLKGTVYEGRIEYVVQKAHEANERCFAELEWKIEGLNYSFKNSDNKKYKNLLQLKYLEIIDEQLLSFWATNRFIPNANMPVGVVSFDVNSNKADYHKTSSTNNPSYSLRDALQQYAPGNSVTIDGRVNIVRGLRFRDFFNKIKAFKKLYHNEVITVIDSENDIASKMPWTVNNEYTLEMIQPTEFLPDVNETENRIMASNVYTRVNAQLIGASDWREIVTEPHLFSVRNNRESGSAKILYYNDGTGHGYCYCTHCGKAVLENKAADSSKTLERLPAEFNNREPEDEERPPYHLDISKKDTFCRGSYNSENIKRNIILGDLIQTDYTEIRIRRKGNKKWINSFTQESNLRKLLITLGLVFRRSLAEILGKDASAIDFTITPNAHICIFDTNPGGAGYSNQLADMDLMRDVIDHSLNILLAADKAKSKDMLLDKFSLHYLEELDIPGAIQWIEEEKSNAATIPDEVKKIFGPSAKESSLSSILRVVKDSSSDIAIFVDNKFDDWDYGDADNGWRGHLYNYFHNKGDQIKFYVVESTEDSMSEPIKAMAREIKSWTRGIERIDNPFIGKQLYPLAYIKGRLYLTNNPEFSSLNDKWGNGTVFVVDYQMDLSKAEQIDLSLSPTTAIIKLSGNEDEEIHSKDLGEIIERKASSIFKEFYSHCSRTPAQLKVVYQDEHLKSVLSIILSLQTIEYFVKKIGKEFSLEFFVEKYQDIMRKPHIAVNLQNNGERDEYLKGLSRIWIDNIEVSGELKPLISQDKNKLTHWRELSFECGGKKLSIYPDGGLLNGWAISRNNSKHFERDETDSNDDILLTRNQEIKIDVTIENV